MRKEVTLLIASLAIVLFAYGGSLWLATGLAARFPRSGVLPLATATAVPFVLAGIFLSFLFRARHRDSQWLYFCDLSGAAGGTLLIIPCLEWLGGVDALLGAGLLAALAGFWLACPSRSGTHDRNRTPRTRCPTRAESHEFDGRRSW